MRETISLLFFLAIASCVLRVCLANRPVPVAPQSTDRMKFVRELGHELEQSDSAEFQLHSIFAHHVSHAGDATLVHRVVPKKKKSSAKSSEQESEKEKDVKKKQRKWHWKQQP